MDRVSSEMMASPIQPSAMQRVNFLAVQITIGADIQQPTVNAIYALTIVSLVIKTFRNRLIILILQN